MSEPNVVLMMLPQKKIAERVPSSSCLYHLLMRNRAPGKKDASNAPNVNRVRRRSK